MPSIHFSAQLTDETCLDIIEFYALDGLKQEIKNWQRERQPELVRLYMRGRPISVIHREIFPEIPEHVLRMHLGWLGFPKSKERDLFIAETYAILQGQACLKCKKDRVECDWGKPACGYCLEKDLACKYITYGDKMESHERSGTDQVVQAEQRRDSSSEEVPIASLFTSARDAPSRKGEYGKRKGPGLVKTARKRPKTNFTRIGIVAENDDSAGNGCQTVEERWNSP